MTPPRSAKPPPCRSTSCPRSTSAAFSARTATLTVLPPFALESPGGAKKFAIVMVTERRGEGEMTYQDVRDRVRQILSEDLAMQKYLAQLRRATYVEVRES